MLRRNEDGLAVKHPPHFVIGCEVVGTDSSRAGAALKGRLSSLLAVGFGSSSHSAVLSAP